MLLAGTPFWYAPPRSRTKLPSGRSFVCTTRANSTNQSMYSDWSLFPYAFFLCSAKGGLVSTRLTESSGSSVSNSIESPLYACPSSVKYAGSRRLRSRSLLRMANGLLLRERYLSSVDQESSTSHCRRHGSPRSRSPRSRNLCSKPPAHPPRPLAFPGGLSGACGPPPHLRGVGRTG